MISYRSSRDWLGLAVVAFVAGLLLWLLFPFALANPNDYFFQPAGDGLQSYYATAFYAFYDHGSHFSGMNYPYGENLTYPNLQPLIAWGINLLERLGLPAASHTVAITNLLALLGIWLTPLICFLILRRLRLPVTYAVVVAVLIAFLSPQVQRLGDHMSLSYPCFVPWLWYCALRMLEAPRQWRWYVIYAVSALLMGFVMAYFLTCASFLLLAYVLVLAVQRGPRPWLYLAYLTVTALLPLVIFRVWLWSTDPTTDRPPNPYGFLVYMTTPSGIFTPYLEPMRTIWRLLLPAGDVGMESMCYVGLVTTGLMLAVAVRTLRLLPQGPRRALRLRRSAPDALRLSLWASFLLLLFACGFPFILPGLDKYIDYLGPIKQFRALGRFSWPFYYVLTTYAAYYLYQVLRYQRQRQVKLLALPWLLVLFVVWAGEAWINIAERAQVASGGAGARDFVMGEHPLLRQLTWANRRPTDFQAILPLPYFNLGSDKIVLTGTGESVAQTHRLSLATGLPQLSSYVSRPSVEQVLRHVQLLSGPLIDKPLLRDFPSWKPILLLVTAQPLTLAEQRLVRLAKPLVSTPTVSLYELTLDSLAATTRARELQRATALVPTLPQRPGGLRATTSKGVKLLDFANSPDRRGRLGQGAFHEPLEKFSVLYDGPVPAPADTGRYEISVWLNGKTGYSYGNMQVKQYDAAGNIIDHQATDAHISTEVDGEWLRVAVPLRVRAATTRLEVLYDNRDLLVDDLLIRPADTDVYWYDAGHRLIYNGYRLQP